MFLRLKEKIDRKFRGFLRRIRRKYSKLKKMIRHEQDLYKALFEHLKTNRLKALQAGMEKIQQLEDLDEKHRRQLFRKFRNDYDRYLSGFDEYYYYYSFPDLTRSQKREFMTQGQYDVVRKKYDMIYPEQRQITARKQKFLRSYRPFIKRKWLFVGKKADEETVQKFLNEYEVIVKPTRLQSGIGIYKIAKGEGDAKMVMSGKLPVLVEECIHNTPELAAFHPSSLNSIRVTTITNHKEVRILGACLRTGNNESAMDNVNSGGYLAEIDVESGMIISDGFDGMRNRMEVHPFSGERFKGTLIPRWDEVIDVCMKASLYRKQTYIVAWDIAVTPEGVDIIEANSRPGMRIHQLTFLKGIRRKLFGCLDELHMPYRDVLLFTDIISWYLHWMQPFH